MENSKNQLASYLENLSLLILGIFFLAFPLVFTTVATEPYILPKQILLIGAGLISLFLFALKNISNKNLRLRRTPFDLPIFLLILFTFLSSILSDNRYESLINFVPLLSAAILYFLIVNTVKSKSSLLFLMSSATFGAAATSLISVLSAFKIYILPFEMTHNTTFSPFGLLFDQAIYLLLILIMSLQVVLPGLIKSLTRKNPIGGEKIEGKTLVFTITSLIILLGFVVTVKNIFGSQKPILLPFETGFQTTFASISQDSGRIAQSFFFGSGFGTYGTDFSRFKQASFNADKTLWSITFYKSSSFVLELLATTGVLGLTAFLFLLIKVLKEIKGVKETKKNIFNISLILIFILSFVFPLTFTIQTAIFMLLGLFSAFKGLERDEESKYYDVEYEFTTSKKSVFPISATPVDELPSRRSNISRIPSITFFVICLLIGGVIGFYSAKYAVSDILFQKSLIAAASNNGLETYNKQIDAIKWFEYKDLYYRVYSQTNMALANSLAASQPKGSSVSAQTQQQILTLIQQSINAGRSAASVSPRTAANWQNLANIYRNLIGFGQNAENFAIATQQEAIALDPNSPQEYINLGGIYYQLGQWDNAQRQFQIAITLKTDLANAYYNLGHTLENKGDLQGAVEQYKIVKSLVLNDKNSAQQIDSEIEKLQTKLGQAQQAKNQTPSSQTESQPGLNVNTPSTQLPQQNPPVKIPGPNSPTPTLKASPTPSASAISPTQNP